MNSRAIQTLTTILCAGLLGSPALAFDGSGARGERTVDPASDPVYTGNHRDGGGPDATGLRGSHRAAVPGAVAGGEPGCVACADVEEGEPNCAIPTDTVNGGCNSTPPVFSSLQCGHDFCGTFASDGEVRDTDWWMFEIQHSAVVSLTVRADFPVQIGFGDLSAGCPIAALMAGVFGDACTPTSIVRTLAPGTYIAFVAPQFSDVLCGARYLGSLSCEALGACCLKGGGCDTLTAAACDAFPGLYMGDGATCVACAPPCPPGPRGDTNCDGRVDFFDIDPFLLALFDRPAYEATFCGGSFCPADVDCSDNVDFFDVDPFIGCMFGGCAACP